VEAKAHEEDIPMGAFSVLLAGESWVSYSIHQKGFNAFTTGVYEEGSEPLERALERKGASVTCIRAHRAGRDFPQSLAGLQKHDVVALSDIGSDTLLLHPDTFAGSKCTADRLELIRQFVEQGGGFIMIGGYLSFQGYGGAAHYRFTPVEEILPVELYDCDDRVECPSGFAPEVVADHEITRGLPMSWPPLLGYNKVKPKGKILVRTGRGDPLLVVGEYGAGRTAAFTSDCSPHWAPPEFVNWDYYGDFWFKLMSWLAKR
jgi:uncharacterized membrane protein